jgi:hypothetical protein
MSNSEIKQHFENAKRFLADASSRESIREHFIDVTNAHDFIEKVKSLGYDCDQDDLKAVVKSYSEKTEIRRNTGIWAWLRTVNWIDSHMELLTFEQQAYFEKLELENQHQEETTEVAE